MPVHRTLPTSAIILAALMSTTLMACDAPLDADVVLTMAERVPTVATVRWQPVHDDADHLFVEVDHLRPLKTRAPVTLTDAGVAEAVLLGLDPDTSYLARAVEVVDGVRYSSDVIDIRTGALPIELPRLSVTATGESLMGGGYLVTSIVAIPCTAVIVDGDGDIVWWHRIETDWDHLFISRVRRSRVGPYIVYQAGEEAIGSVGANERGEVVIVKVAFDGTVIDTVETPAGHHDFAELPDGSLAFLSHDKRQVDDLWVTGDRIVEIRPDGTEVEVWSMWEYAEFEGEEIAEAPIGDWTHANALEYDHDADDYYVSLRNRDAILRIDRASGEVLWQLGGADNDFALDDADDPPFQRQHQFQVLDDGIIVFDNGLASEASSRVVEYALDEDALTATLRWSYEPDPPLFSVGLGDVNVLPSGNRLVVWSAQGRAEEFTEDHEVVWQLGAGLGGAFGYGTWRETLYQ